MKQYLEKICKLNKSLTLHQALKEQVSEMSALKNKPGSVEPLIKVVYSSTANAALKRMAEQTDRYGRRRFHVGFIVARTPAAASFCCCRMYLICPKPSVFYETLPDVGMF